MLGLPIWISQQEKGNKTSSAATYLIIDRKSGFAPLDWFIGSK
jgi:hypothetical protein